MDINKTQLKDLIYGEVLNYINFWTSDEKERENMQEVLDNYMKEDYTYEDIEESDFNTYREGE